MDKNTAETIVKVYAVLAWISALIMLIVAIAIMIGGSMMGTFGSMMYGDLAVAGMVGAVATVVAVILLALAAFDVIVGIGLWTHKPWARILTIIYSVLSLFSFPIGTLIGAFGIWLFGFESTVKSLFGVKTARVAKKATKKAAKKAKKKKKQ